MSDVRVDYATREARERPLRQLKSECDNLEARVGDRPGGGGQGDVSSAMREFSGNMDHHRRKLTEKIAECGDKVSTTLETSRASDEGLARPCGEEL